MSQEGRTKTLVMGPGNAQLNAMLKDLEKGLAFVTGYWFDPHMNWLDGDECGGQYVTENCNKNPAYISNWRITSNDRPVPTPAPTPKPPTPPTPPPPPTPVKVGHCCWGGCNAGCQNDPSNYCNQAQSNCEGSCGGQWC